MTSKLVLMSYRLTSVLHFGRMSFLGLWAVTASFVSAESICSVLRRRDDHTEFWIDSEMGVRPHYFIYHSTYLT